MSYLRRLNFFAINKRFVIILSAVILSLFMGLFIHTQAQAAEPKNIVNLYIFWGEGCPHCAKAKEVLEPYVEQNDNIGYESFEVYYSVENQKKMQAVGEVLKVEASGVPFIIVGDEYYLGFSAIAGDEIIERLEYCSIHSCPDSVSEIVGAMRSPTQNYTTNTDTATSDRKDKLIELPFIGTVNAAHFSLPILTAIFGLLDGFNPCAMWALLFIISLLIGMKDRRKMWLYGTAFIGTSAAVYFIFMIAWLNMFMFIGHVAFIRVAIGLLAIGIGAYYLYDWYQNQTGCKVTSNGKSVKVFAKLRTVVQERNIWLGLGGIVVLAAAVNIVELACSAGLPVLYTGILSSAGLETWQYYAYMLLYILFFMLDDLIVFIIAMTTLRVVGIESKYTRATRLVGGVLMVILGILLIFAPQVLLFG